MGTPGLITLPAVVWSLTSPVCAADTLNMILSASSAHKSDPKQRYFAGKVSMVSLSSQLGKVSLSLGVTATLLMARHVGRGWTTPMSLAVICAAE